MRLLVFSLLGLLSLPAGAQTITLAAPFPDLPSFSSPVDFQHPGDGSDLLFVVEQNGTIKVFANDPGVDAADTFLDIEDRVTSGGERGLLGLAFDPDYATNGFFYVNYTVSNPRRQRVSRFTRTTATAADPNSEEILYEGDPALAGWSNHNAGAIAFGPPEGPGDDRYLYVTHGDGGAFDDQGEHGQDLGTLLGTIVRLDVNGGGGPLDCADAGSATVPADNPFADGPGGDCDEIYAYGLRNPYRMSFDSATDDLWVGDVGQNQWEEIDLIEAGGNYGWNTMEGFHCFDPSSGCDQSGLTLPIYEYSHAMANCSITGGYVYRGALIPELVGEYVYGDYCTGAIWRLAYDGMTATNELIQHPTGLSPSAFGVDAEGELYIVSLNGELRQLLRTPPTATEEEPTTQPALMLTGANPVQSSTTLRLSIPTDSPATLALFDVLGRRVATLFEGTLRAGTATTVTVQTEELADGIYVARLHTQTSVESLTLSVVR
ncbi:MAG: glucose sorbosone dehydrogenase [Rhodothermaceae bacterium]|nr:glucose sorbosone dehydrogenase [Rhodothermaceae bacterium]